MRGGLATQLAPCVHCGLPVPNARAETSYCCQGCEQVAAFLSNEGRAADATRREGPAGAPSQPSGRAYEELDDPSFQREHVQAPDLAGSGRAATLYLEGTHCAACLWLVERLPRICPGVLTARLDLSRGLAHVRWDSECVSLSQIAQTLDRLGYRVHPYRIGEEATRRREEDRAALVRLAVAGALAGNVMLISFATYGGIWHGMQPAFASLFRWAACVLSLIAVFGPGRTFLRGAWAALRTRVPHVDLPVSIALLTGIAGGLANTIQGGGEVYFDTVAVLVFLLLIGRWLQGRQRRRAAETSELLTALAPSRARRLEPEGARVVPLDVLQPGDRLEILGGERVPADGVVREGQGTLDRSLLTGEARPVATEPGARVHAGEVCRAGRLVVEVEATGRATRLAKILRHVESLSARKAPVVTWANRVAGTLVLAVLVLAVLTFVGWRWAAPELALDHALALLIVTCPCALGLATPLAIDAALGQAARLGAIVKGGDVLQRLAGQASAQLGPLAFLDKTGTLSQGQFRLQTWEIVAGEDDERTRRAVLALEAASSHPIAAGFREAWSDAAGEVPAAACVRELPGGGLEAVLSGERWRIGAPRALAALGTALDPAWVESLTARGESPVGVTRDGAWVALAGFGDALRVEALRAVQDLQANGWRVELLSGDHPDVVEALGTALGVAQAEGGATPEAKAARIEAARAEGYGPILMVGDGVNDAAALAAADVGVGVRGGSIAALEAADVYLTEPGVGALSSLNALARNTLARIRLNLGLSLAYNLLAAALAAAGLIDPILAAILMPLSSLGVVANSYRGLALEPRPLRSRRRLHRAGFGGQPDRFLAQGDPLGRCQWP
ncbi:MAG: heavy metal translocating P-type ATPase [Planctomycetes bacterium]|nr:heavy metal translocating P-type ATPase [Planctomycetota bacterium]